MSYKTLIVFDTNKLRDSNNSDLRYADFVLGGDYKFVDSFIKEKGLKDYVHIAVPEIVIRELLKQKTDQYATDVSRFKSVAKSLQEVGVVKEVEFFDLDIKKFLNEKQKEFFTKNYHIKILCSDKSDHAEMFRNILNRSVEKRAPFKKGTDAGFKDVVIWETLLKNFSNTTYYDEIFFLTDDSGFDGCEREFIEKKNKSLEIIKDLSLLQAKIESSYADIIENQEIFSLIQTSYFDDQIKDYIKYNIEKWEKDGEEFDIVGVEILNKCTKFEKIEGDSSLGIDGVFLVETYVGLDLEREDSDGGTIVDSTDAYITSTIDEANEITDFELE